MHWQEHWRDNVVIIVLVAHNSARRRTRAFTRSHVAFQTQTNTRTNRIFPCGAVYGAGKLRTSDIHNRLQWLGG